MKKIFNKYTIIGLVSLFLFLVLIVLLKVDVAKLGENESEVGLSSINKKFVPNKTNDMWNDLSDLILYFGIFVLFLFVVKGLFSLFDKGSIFKVEKDIIVLGFCTVFLICVWIFFDKILIINYRPFFEHEGSYPSTHILIVVFMSLYSYLYVCRTNDYKSYRIPVAIIGTILSLIVFIGRIKSGNHFFTDCVGAVILALATFFVAKGILYYFDLKEENSKVNE